MNLLYIAQQQMSIRIPNIEGGEELSRVGAVLKACRTRAGFTQEELADRLFISQSDVSKYENDTMEPHLSTLQAWTSCTQAPEVLVAFLCGVDGISIMQSIIEAGLTISLILGGIL